jgi:hypothetical protein
VVQSLDRHVPSIAEAVRGGPGRPFSRVWRISLGTEQGLWPRRSYLSFVYSCSQTIYNYDKFHPIQEHNDCTANRRGV